MWPFLVYGIAVVSLVGGILFISYFLGERHEEAATDEAYEGGIIATGTARLRFPVDFYILAIFFVIFDVEAAFLLSWAVSIRAAGWTGYAAVGTFIGVQLILLVYLWKTGALDFGPDGRSILKAFHQKIKKQVPYAVVDKQSK
ncbi:MAG: NADH-quinone oxidoreductase subunit A [Puia sp.]|nr:NADH-quinone oxidoreductase subunit A [Puia sp.]